ncbi:hypothetical protein like AT4G30380 [Hibiscus trionum]|uniref:Expansin-like EG45 domain-containing protein n=1 Tax=Hibiscus trionum TaxID=183268 RepID=A0A9W7JHN3_HIBTR|nr:hypothetical protein like AT4G30380 [Hibiscus trionum]
MDKITLIFVGIVACLVSIAAATPGIASFYTDYVPSTCFGMTPQGNAVAQVDDALWENGAACGKLFTVTCTGPRTVIPHPCTGKSATVMVVEHCPECTSTFVLSREAFAFISDPLAGKIDIDYHPYALTHLLVISIDFSV